MEEKSQQLQHPSPIRHHGGSGANQQHQHKLLKDYSADGSGHLADSGYNSYHSINASCSVARSVLATIEEDNEPVDSSFEEPVSARKATTGSSILTPSTTASLAISNFHLTTPKENVVAQRRTLARKPTCQNLFALRTPEKSAGSSSVETPVRSGRKSAELGILTPRKNKTSAKRKHASFREKLYSDGDADTLENDCKKLDQEDISPIFHNKRRRNSDIDDLIRSSTPKTAGFKSNFHIEAQENQKPANRKALVLRKFQSFSPSKMHSYRKRDSVLQEKSVLANRKAPLQRQNAVQQTTPRKPSLEASLELSFEPIPQVVNPTPCAFGALLDAPILPQTNDDLKLDLNEEVSQLPSFDDCSFTPTKPSTSSLPVEPDSVLRDASVAQRRRSIPSILEQQLESPVLFSPNIPRTPKSSRKLKRLNSSSKKDKQPRSKPASPKHHRDPVIPGTYRRHYDGVERLNILKRLNEHDKDAMEIVLGYLADSDLVRVVTVSRGWRSIIESDRRLARRLRDYLAREAHSKENLDRSGSTSRDESKLVVSYDGGVVPPGKLVHQSSSVVRQPFSLCNSIDAGNHSAMNTTVPKSPPVSPSRRKFHENQKIASHLKKSERLKPCPRCGKPSRVVAAHSNGINNNKTIARSNSSTTTKSNRLSMASSHAIAKLEKSYTLPDASGASAVISPPPSPPISSSSNSSPGDGSAERIRRNLFSTSSGGLLFPSRACSVDGGGGDGTPVVNTRAVGTRRSSSDATPLDVKGRGHPRRRQSSEESQCDYAVCSGKGCGFTFCVKCLCEHHPDAVCKDLAPNSPSKEDAPSQYVACSKASRRSLRRLC